MRDINAEELIGCCGLFCGLCSKYQSRAQSRCIGCQIGEQHSWCSIWNCCVKKHGYKNCTECKEIFKCQLFIRRKVEEWIPAPDNLRQIRSGGLERWLSGQIERKEILEELLQKYNEGRSMSYYCKVCAKMPIKLIYKAITEVKENIIKENIRDIKIKAKIMKTVINKIANENNLSIK